jgi:PEP-CTERM motif
MKKSFMLLLAFCGVMAVLLAPGIVMADNFVFVSDMNPHGSYRDFSLFIPYCLDLGDQTITPNAVEQLFAAHVEYTPQNSTSPGWVDPAYDWPSGSGQHTYVLNFPSPTGGQLQNIPGLHPQTGTPGLLVLEYVLVPLPTTHDGFADPAFLNNVGAIVYFEPGVSTAVVYENSHVPEPGVLLLLGFGLMALAGMRRVVKAKA